MVRTWVFAVLRRRPAKLLFLLVSLGASFGFIAVVAMIAHASWFRLPSAVEHREYVSFARQTVDGFERMSRADFECVGDLFHGSVMGVGCRVVVRVSTALLRPINGRSTFWHAFDPPPGRAPCPPVG